MLLSSELSSGCFRAAPSESKELTEPIRSSPKHAWIFSGGCLKPSHPKMQCRVVWCLFIRTFKSAFPDGHRGLCSAEGAFGCHCSSRT